MAIVKMREISLLALIEDRSAILNLLQDSGAVQIITEDENPDGEENAAAAEAENEEREKYFGKANFSDREDILRQIERLDAYSQRLEKVLAILRQRHPDLVPKELPAKSHGEFFSVIKQKNSILEELIRLEEAFEEEKKAEQNLIKLKQNEEELRPWVKYSFDLGKMSTRETAFVAGRAENALKAEEFKKKLEQNCDFPYFVEEKIEENSEDIPKEQKAVLMRVCALAGDFPALKEVALSSSLQILNPERRKGSPAELFDANERKIRATQKKLDALQDEIERAAKDAPRLMALADFYAIRIRRMNAEAMLSQSRYAFSLKGWIPAAVSEEIKSEIEENFTAAVYLRDTEEGENHPIALKNRPFSKAYEILLKMFGAPNVGEVDPTPVLAPATFIFFGMMLSDIGYGILLSLLCYHLVSKNKVKGENRELCAMLFVSGISSTIWGFVFGGFFGNLLPAVTGGKVNSPCLWFNPLDDPMKLLIWSMLFGILHLFVGMGIKMVNMIRQGDTIGAILDVVPWYLIVGGLAVYGGADSINPALAQPALYVVMFGALVLVLTGGRKKKNIFAKFFSGLLSLYDITGYLGDILSYARVLALVLATSVIAMVVNDLGMMFGRSVFGYIAFAIIAIFGHTVNLALSALSAYVHSARLQYVEFFGKFFEGGGKFFDPLRLETKHIPIKKR